MRKQNDWTKGAAEIVPHCILLARLEIQQTEALSAQQPIWSSHLIYA